MVCGRLHPAEAIFKIDCLGLIALKLGIFLYTEERTTAPEWVLKPICGISICSRVRLDHQEGSAAIM